MAKPETKTCKKCLQTGVPILGNGLLARHKSPEGQVCLGPKNP